jgi:choline transport protein
MKINPYFGLPINALVLVGSVVVLLSMIYIASATAFNALISLQSLALYVSYFFPILFILFRRIRGPAPMYGPFKLGRCGVPVNVVSLMYLLFVILWMPFPQLLPVTKDNMNYAGPVFGAVVLLALGDWLFSGKARFNITVKDSA